MIYKGSCHCGQIAFEAEGELGRVMECNCSMCSKRGALHWLVPGEQFSPVHPGEPISVHVPFRTRHQIQHHLCPRCGCAPFGEGADGSVARRWQPSTPVAWMALRYRRRSRWAVRRSQSLESAPRLSLPSSMLSCSFKEEFP